MQEGIFVDINYYYVGLIIWIITIGAIFLAHVMDSFLKTFPLYKSKPLIWDYSAPMSAGLIDYEVSRRSSEPVYEEDPDLEEWLAQNLEEEFEDEDFYEDDEDIKPSTIVLADHFGNQTVMRIAMMLDDNDTEVYDIADAATVLAHHDKLGWHEVSMKENCWEIPTIH